MIRTRRYKTIWDGSNRFVGFDRLHIDPATTDIEARKHVDNSEVEALAAEFAKVELTEENFIRWQTLKYKLALAVQRYETAVRNFALQNPVHFEPREGEEIICPLIENAKKTRID